MFLFLQNIRATLIPTIAVPVILLGTFAVLSLAGFSINTLTMFGMVLAIGLLVDDAIVDSLRQMVPFAAFSQGSWIYGSPKLERYNGSPSAEILGEPAPGLSTGSAMDTMEKLSEKLPPGIGFDWTGLSYEERAGGSQVGILYAISLTVVFLSLAALYESWSIPVAVILVVPLGVLGAVLATFLRGLSNDVFFQVGLLTTIGLSAKNAILIVEFAKENFEKGMNLVEAAKHAAAQRLRPILMTSFAFVMGVLPLAISSGAGSGG